MPLTGLEDLPDMGALRTARKGDSISSILGSSDPAAIGAFMEANGMKDSRLRVGESYLIPRRADLTDAAFSGRGQAALNADNARAAQRARSAIIPGDAVTVRPGAALFDPQKGLLTAGPQTGLLSTGTRPRKSGYAAASDIAGGFGIANDLKKGAVEAAVNGGKELAAATDDFGTAKRVLKGIKGANIGLTIAGEGFGLADDLKNKVPARVAVPGAVLHGLGSLGAGAMGGAVGGAVGTLLIPIPGVGTALGTTAGSIGASILADKFGPTRAHLGWEFDKLQRGR